MPLPQSGLEDWTLFLESILASHQSAAAWITNDVGSLKKANKESKKFPTPDFIQILAKHNTKIDSQFPEPFTFSISSNNSLRGNADSLISASKIKLGSHSYYLFVHLNQQPEADKHNDLIEAEELGIFGWAFFPSQNRFVFPEKGWKKIMGIFAPQPTYDDFFSCFGAEALQKFSRIMEEAINFGKTFSTELMVDLPSGYSWIQMTCQSIDQSTRGLVLKGYIKDLSVEKNKEEEINNLNLWLHSGLAQFKIENARGETIKNWEGHSKGPNIQLEGARRTTRLVDFRNNLKYKITADLGEAISGSNSPLPVSTQEILDSEPIVQIPQKGNLDQKFITVNQWLGQSLDAKVSAMGVFNGHQFEWKAWWKSPVRYELRSEMSPDEWIPPLNWLEEIERDKESQSIWWPQEMLPFSIENQYGEGWMLLTDSLSDRETTLFAIQSDDPESIREKTRHVLKGISLLKSAPSKNENLSENDQLRQQLEEKDLLLKELNHRAKNNLSIASGLVKMQSAYSENEEISSILKQTQKRLETLATLHEHLYQTGSGSGKVDMKEYLTKIVHALMDGFGSSAIRLELNIDSIQLENKIANTVGLLVNELISNSFKYAFSKNPNGVLKVDFLLKGSTIKLRVSDNGPGIQKPAEEKDSLGKLLISEFVEQLKGTMEIVTPPGTTYLITFAVT